MAVREIVYKIGMDDNGNSISPAALQKGGVQGDHGVTALRFIIQNGLYDTLAAYKQDGRELLYHFDAVDGEGGQHHFAPAQLENKEIVFPLEEPVTRYGGLVKVTLVITVMRGEKTELESFSFPAQLKLTFSPHTNTDKQGEYQSMATLAQVTKQNARLAEEKASEAKEAQVATEAAKTAFQGGATYIFDGGNATGSINAKLIVENEMKDFSQNPVANGVVKKYIDDKFPVGSVWVGGKKYGEPINPSAIFGGEWRLMDKQFKTARYHITDKEELKKYIKCEEDRVGTNIDVSDLYVEYNDHNVVLTVLDKTSAALNDNRRILAYLNIGDGNPWGIEYTKTSDGLYEDIIYPELIEGRSDSGTSIGLLRATSQQDETIMIECNDIIGAAELSAGVELNFTFTMNFLPQNMRNSFCDRFYWERVI